MRVLITGSAGPVGAHIAALLEMQGSSVVRFDIVDGYDVLDIEQLRRAASGCDSAVHCAVKGHPGDTAQDTLATNFIGTWNVVTTAKDTAIRRLVYLSSVNAFGVFRGERPPDYFPIDIRHPCYPRTAYGVSKRLGEDVCELLTAGTDITTFCLRLPEVWMPTKYGERLAAWTEEPRSEWEPFWEYGAFIDVRDVAAACSAALMSSARGFTRLLLCAPDIATSGPSAFDWVTRLHPSVPWTDQKREPRNSLLSTTEAEQTLGWKPQYTWHGFLSSEASRKSNT